MPMVIVIACIVELLGMAQVALDPRMPPATFGIVLGMSQSAIMRTFTILVSGLIIFGLWRRFWIGAIAYAAVNLISVVSSICNFLALGPEEIHQMTGERAQPMSSVYMVAYVLITAVLTIAVLQRRDYFTR